MIRRMLTTLTLVAAVVPVVGGGTAGAVVFQRTYAYPSADCPGTLQDCITNAVADSIIEIASGTVVNESPIISKTITIIGTTSNAPEIEGDVVVNDANGSVNVTLADFHVV